MNDHGEVTEVFSEILCPAPMHIQLRDPFFYLLGLLEFGLKFGEILFEGLASASLGCGMCHVAGILSAVNGGSFPLESQPSSVPGREMLVTRTVLRSMR
ncbi:hypothetical protein C9J85_01935 [Haloferax sp. wsp5]|nr:hypothetical protein C9J85_01935 [Haloferax sp. wsp5]